MPPTPRAALSAAALLLAGAAIPVLLAGPLNPPAGPVASTYKTLTEVEPRIAVNATNTPGFGSAVFRITAPGSYYLTANAAAPAGQDGIHISASNVTLDLNGFTISGVAGSGNGIRTIAVVSAVTIRSGVITGFPTRAVDTLVATNVVLEDLQVAACPSGLVLGGRSTARRVTVAGATADYAIYMDPFSVIEDCHIYSSPDGIRVNGGCTVRGCSGEGLTSNGINLAGGGCLVTGNRLRGSETNVASGTGITAGNAGSTIEGNHLSWFTTGVQLSAQNNVVARNTVSTCTTNLSAVANNLAAPFVTSATIGTNTNPDANYDN